MGKESSAVVRFDLWPLLQGQTRIATLKSAYNSLIIGPTGLQCETNLYEIMGLESSDVVRFDLGHVGHDLNTRWSGSRLHILSCFCDFPDNIYRHYLNTD